MANQRREGVSYRQFRAQPNLAEGLLGVSREGGGELERGIAAGLARLSGYFGAIADEQTEDAYRNKARQDVSARAPGAAKIEGGEATTASVNGQAGHVRGARGGIRAKVPPAELRNMIADAAVRHGVNPDALTQIAGIESSFNPNAQNPNSSAGGLFQFIDGTAQQYGLRNRFDPAESSDAAARLARDNTKILRERLSREPTAGELYLAHQQGGGGAAKLLANPAARAVDVVGRDAVLLNGGNENMTAGEFASLWTSKVSGGRSYSAMPESSSVGPGEVTPVDRPVTVTPGAPGTWRPMPGNSRAARAYNEEGARYYKQMLEQAMVDDQEAVYEAYKDDPAMLEKAYGELLAAHRKDHLFPEIELDYSLAFERRAKSKVQQARENRERIRAAEEQSAFRQRLNEFENTKSRMLAGLDPASDAAAADLAALQGTIDQHYDSAVARGVITEDQAQEAKTRGRADLMAVFYVKQASGKSPDEIRTMREEMARDYAEGGLEGVDAAAWEKISDGFDAAEREAKTQGDLAAKALRQRGNDIVERQMRGLPVGADEVAQFQMDLGTAPNGRDIGASVMMRLRVAEAIRTQPVQKVRDGLWQLMTADGATPSPDDYDAAVKMVNAHEADIKADPLAVAERYGVIPQQPALPDPLQATPDEMAQALSARIVFADVAASHFGVPPVILRPEEKAQIKTGALADNPERFRASMTQLDILSGKLGLTEVERMFDKDTVDRLQDWQGRLRYATPDEAQKWLTERNSPQWDERIKPLVSKGRAEAKKIETTEVVEMLDTNRFWDANAPLDAATSRAMMADFERLVGERYATTSDMGTAKDQAVERMRKVWGVTGIYGERGGRLMLYPPEAHYPSIAGSTNWLSEELKDVAQQRGIDMETLSLVSDGKTKAAIDRGEPPGYLLTKVDPESGLEQIVTDEKGRPLRHFFDPKAAQDKALEKAKAARETRNDPWLVLGKGTAVGPLYLGGADAADLADRQRRIDATLSERESMIEGKKAIRERLRNADIPGLPVPPEQQ